MQEPARCALYTCLSCASSLGGVEDPEQCNDGVLDSKLENSACGTSCDSFGERGNIVSIDTRGRTPISARQLVSTPNLVLPLDRSAISSGGPTAVSLSIFMRPFPLSTLLDRRDLRKPPKLKNESLRVRGSQPEPCVPYARNQSNRSRSISALDSRWLLTCVCMAAFPCACNVSWKAFQSAVL